MDPEAPMELLSGDRSDVHLSVEHQASALGRPQFQQPAGELQSGCCKSPQKQPS